MLPDWVIVILLGIVEGITEFLPISSTGHLLLLGQYLGRQTDLFNIVIQSGAVLAVIPLFAQRLRWMLEGWREPQVRDYAAKLLSAFLLTGVGGVLLDKRGFRLPEQSTPVIWALIVGGVLFLIVEYGLKNRTQRAEVTWTIALAVGLGQLLAMVFPGASRSGTTILVALILGLSRPAATEFTFLVGIPTMLAAGGLKIARAILSPTPGAPPEHWGLVLLGTIVAAAVSFVVVKWLLRYVQRHTFNLFAWYRIGLGILMLLLARSNSL